MAEEGAVIGCHTVEEWNHQLELAKESHKLVVVDFTASWCGPCRMIAPIFADLAKKITNAVFLKVDVDQLKTVAREWNIEAMPTFIFLKDGATLEKLVGAQKEVLTQKVTTYANQ